MSGSLATRKHRRTREHRQRGLSVQHGLVLVVVVLEHVNSSTGVRFVATSQPPVAVLRCSQPIAYARGRYVASSHRCASQSPTGHVIDRYVAPSTAAVAEGLHVHTC
jgi:hypothetical protein